MTIPARSTGIVPPDDLTAMQALQHGSTSGCDEKMTVRDGTQPWRAHAAQDLKAGHQAGYQVRVCREPENPAWDAFLAETPGGHHVQTSLWAQVKAVLGWRSARVIVTRHGRIVAGAQLLMRTLPMAGAIGYVARGPVRATNDPALTKLVIHELHRVARARRIQYLVVQPPCNDQALAQQLPRWGFRRSFIEGQPTATVLVDLTQDLDHILAQMRKTTRRNIRRGHRRGISVREGTWNDLDTFYELLVATGRRQGFSPEPEEYFATMWRVLHPHGYLRLFLAEYDSDAVSAHLVIPFGDTVISKISGWSGHHVRRHPNEVLDWTVIKWAKSQGYRYCDLEGIDPDAARAVVRGKSLPDALRSTPTFFKLGFGGQVTFFPGTYDYVYNPVLRWIYSAIFPAVARSSTARHTLQRVADTVRGLGRG